MGGNGSLQTGLTSVALAALMAAAACMLQGCDTIQSDFASLKEEIMPPTPTEAATWMFDEYDAEKRRKGLVLISNSPFGAAEVYVKAYRLRIEEENNPIVKAAAIRALARHGATEDAVLIASQLTDEAQQVRWEAAKGLQRLHNPAVVPAMLDAFRGEDENVDVRVAIASALAQYPEDRVFQALIQHGLGARELVLNKTANQSLATLTGQDFGENSGEWLSWYGDAADPFAGKQPYYYPTYQRDPTLFDHLTFWTSTEWEQSQQPVGLRPDTSRTTYGDDMIESSGG